MYDQKLTILEDNLKKETTKSVFKSIPPIPGIRISIGMGPIPIPVSVIGNGMVWIGMDSSIGSGGCIGMNLCLVSVSVGGLVLVWY